MLKVWLPDKLFRWQRRDVHRQTGDVSNLDVVFCFKEQIRLGKKGYSKNCELKAEFLFLMFK